MHAQPPNCAAMAKAWAKPHIKHIPKLHNAFKSQFVHGDLQVTMDITFCCIPNHHLNQNSHCWYLNLSLANQRIASTHYMHSVLAKCTPTQSPNATIQYTQHSAQAQHNMHTAVANTNDSSAGSPTETLLQLLLPLSDKVHHISQTKPTHWTELQSK